MESMNELAASMKERAALEQPYTTEEVQGIITSLQSLLPTTTSTEGEDDKSSSSSSFDMEQLATLLSSVAHLSHKQWDRTGASSSALQDILLPSQIPSTADVDGSDLPPAFRTVMERVLNEGNWYGAVDAAKKKSDGTSKPWAILVTGVNGIRKTTSVYQPWFPALLKEALVPPKTAEGADAEDDIDIDVISVDDLPTGNNSFFRQLDHMIVILANTEFARLYDMTGELENLTRQKQQAQDNNDRTLDPHVIDSYARLKDAIFTRYRTLAEMLGILLLRLSVEQRINVMVETSGRDVAMFHYVEKFFPDAHYHRLVLHFTVNDLVHAEHSVDRRMTEEIQEGRRVSSSSSNGSSTATRNMQELVYANKGGPYGSEVLQGVQRDSDRVWTEQVINTGGVGESWYKAEIAIEAREEGDWSARAIVRDNNGDEVRKGTAYTFERRT